MGATRKLTWKNGILLFVVCWLAAFLVVGVLRTVLIPKDERDCHARVRMIQKAVEDRDRMHPSDPVRGDLDTGRMVSLGLVPQGFAYDAASHYYFVGETAHGWRVKCNRHEDNPLLLRLTGVTLLALVLWVVAASLKRYTLS